MLAALATALLPAAASAGIHVRAHSAIVGGHFAGNGQLPWVVRIVARSGRVVDGCSGTVVAANLVLTAGHCVEEVRTGAPRKAADFDVLTAAGETTNKSSRVSRVIVYPGFDRKSGVGDAALLQLSTPAGAPSIQLASQAKDWAAGTPAVMAGWGRDGVATSTASPSLLRWANTVVQSPESCAARLRGFHAGRELCAMNAPSDNTAGCAGDSGGPLLVERGAVTFEIGVLDGSVVRGSKVIRCLTTEPTVYASSSVISGWVREWIQRLNYVPIAVTEGASPASGELRHSFPQL